MSKKHKIEIRKGTKRCRKGREIVVIKKEKLWRRSVEVGVEGTWW